MSSASNEGKQIYWLSWALQEEVPPSEAYEHSEMILYRALVLEEGGQVKEALEYLDSSKVTADALCVAWSTCRTHVHLLPPAFFMS